MKNLKEITVEGYFYRMTKEWEKYYAKKNNRILTAVETDPSSDLEKNG